jgi:hypothetical protein
MEQPAKTLKVAFEVKGDSHEEIIEKWLDRVNDLTGFLGTALATVQAGEDVCLPAGVLVTESGVVEVVYQEPEFEQLALPFAA